MNAHIDAIGVVAKDLKKTLAFYDLLGFSLRHIAGEHYEAEQENGLRFMIDTEALLTSMGQPPATPASFASFALKYESTNELDEMFVRVRDAGNEVAMEPVNMPWGQRYATIKDPNGNRIDMFAWLPR